MNLAPEDQELVGELNEGERAGHGFPPPEAASDRRRAADLVEEVLVPLFDEPPTIRLSPLGPEWSADVDVHVPFLPDPGPLRAAGWLHLAPLLARVGITAERWAVVDRGRVVGAADLVVSAAPSAVRAVVDRATRRGEVRLREVLEFRALLREGAELPTDDPVLSAAASLERAWGGVALTRWLVPGSASVPRSPVPLRSGRPGMSTARDAAAAARRVARRRLVVAFSGVDGSGKSSLTSEIAAQLRRAGVPVTIVWSRPGMRLGFLGRVGMVVRRRRYGATPGVRAVAAGAGDVPVRQGLLGWLWATLVAAAYVVDVRCHHAAARGVVLYDRHLLDGLVTLDFVYEGVHLGVARRLVRLALPRAHASFYVRVPAEVAVARKPDDSFGDHAVRRQLEKYDDRLPGVHGVVMLDGTDPKEALVAEVLRHLATSDAR